MKRKKTEVKRIIVYKIIGSKMDETSEIQYLASYTGRLTLNINEAIKFDDDDQAKKFLQSHFYLGKMLTRYEP